MPLLIDITAILQEEGCLQCKQPVTRGQEYIVATQGFPIKDGRVILSLSVYHVTCIPEGLVLLDTSGTVQ